MKRPLYLEKPKQFWELRNMEKTRTKQSDTRYLSIKQDILMELVKLQKFSICLFNRFHLEIGRNSHRNVFLKTTPQTKDVN